jgi:hypothetical protein
MKKQKQQTAPEYTTDADGQQLAHVALANTDQRATLYAEDYQRLMDAGFSPAWCLSGNGCGSAYPAVNAFTTQGHNRLVTIARLIAAPGVGKRVRCADGDALNLRTENLKLEDAPVRRSAADWFPHAAALRAAGFAPVVRERTDKARGARKAHSAPIQPAAPQQTPTAPAEPRQPFTPRVVDVAALGQRVREQMAAKAAEVTA